MINEIASQFLMGGRVLSCETHGNGNVNDTFLLHCENGDHPHRFTLQRINHDVFRNPEGLMKNFSRVTRHLQSKISSGNQDKKCLSLVPTIQGNSFHQDSRGNYWRMTKFVDGGRSLEVPDNLNQAYEAAKAFGEFQASLVDLPAESLIETIPDFHNTRMRFDDFRSIVKEDPQGRANEVKDLIEFALQRERLADTIMNHEFPVRIVHNDTKLNNVLLHKSSGKGMCVVDLDTVMPGCILHDFGDLVRTAASSAIEDEAVLEKVYFLPDTFSAIVQGYLESAGGILEKKEIDHLPVAPLVITYELGLRFLSDHINGDRYFKIKRPNHNLDRVRAQFKLLSSMEENLENIRGIVSEHGKRITEIITS